MQKEQLEIERKWVLKPGITKEQFEKALENLTLQLRGELRQAYIFSKPVEVRIRHMKYSKGGEYYKLDNKIGSGLTRVELSHVIDKETYEYILAQLGGRAEILKDYRQYTDGSYTIEVSFVDNGKMTYLEVEFNSDVEAKSYTLPKCINDIVEEVTDKPGYSMNEYWMNTRSFKSFQ